MAKDSMMREIGRVISSAYESEKENRLSLNNRIPDLIRKKNENLPFDSVLCSTHGGSAGCLSSRI
jgi:hypothetical protein